MPAHKKNRSSQRKAAAQSIDAPFRFARPIGLALILLTTFVVYLPALNGARLWDDNAHITSPELQSLSGLCRIWFEPGATQQYYPMLHTAFWLEHKLWGDSVVGYHLVNVLWHMLAVTLVYLNLKKLKVPGAILAAAIFAVHPVMVESVAWISEQKNTLSAVFYLGAMRVYLNFDDSRRRSHYLAALTLFVLGLLTKTVTATLPAALLVIFWWQRGTLSWKRDWLPLLPFFLLGAAAGVLTAWVERTLIGAEGADFQLTFLQRGMLAGRVIWFYLSKLLWPANLIFIYSRWNIDPTAWWQWLFPAATLGVLVVLWLLRRKTRAPLAAWLYFCGTLFPVLGFLNVYPFIYSFVADHFQYLASLGMFTLAAAGIAQGLARLSPRARSAGGATCVLVLAVLSVLTFRQSGMYANSIKLYETTIERNPTCWMAHNNLGSQLVLAGKPQAAMEHYQRALAIKADYFLPYNNLGTVLAEAGQFPEAVEQFRIALKMNPNYFRARKNLGLAFVKMGRLPEAIQEYQAALELKHDDAELLTNLGLLLTATGQPQQAIEHYQAATRANPNYFEAYENLAKAQALLIQPNEAIASAEHAIDLARRTGQQAAAERIAEWLKSYRIELQRAGDVVPSSK